MCVAAIEMLARYKWEYLGCLKAGIVLGLLALTVLTTWLCATAALTRQKPVRCNEKTARSGRRLGKFDRGLRAECA